MKLLEALVALILTAGLLTLLLGSYLRATQTHNLAGQELWPAIEEHALHQRLTQLITNTSATDPHVSCDGQTLTFIFHNDVDDDPQFSAEVVGHLALDSHNRVVLTTWPSPHRWDVPNLPTRHETLTHASTLTFSFFEREEGWFDSWQRDELPTLIKIKVGDFNQTYALPNANKPVRYRK
jgi:hypothetical protein